MSRINKRFTSDQVKEVPERYSKKQMKTTGGISETPEDHEAMLLPCSRVVQPEAQRSNPLFQNRYKSVVCDEDQNL